MIELNKIHNEDCLIGMNRIPDKSVDMILCDLPYGTTACKWDVVIPFEPLWAHYERVIKDNGAIVLTASQPFTSHLVMSNIKLFKYEWIWKKTQPNGFLNAKKMPLKYSESVLVFYKKSPVYNPQFRERPKENIKPGRYKKRCAKSEIYGEYEFADFRVIPLDKLYPSNVIEFANQQERRHPTQKPTPLFAYFIRTYTNRGDTVLDNCMGSGTTAIACIQEDRNFIGFEMNKKFYDDSIERIEKELAKSEQLKLIV